MYRTPALADIVQFDKAHVLERWHVRMLMSATFTPHFLQGFYTSSSVPPASYLQQGEHICSRKPPAVMCLCEQQLWKMTGSNCLLVLMNISRNRVSNLCRLLLSLCSSSFLLLRHSLLTPSEEEFSLRSVL